MQKINLPANSFMLSKDFLYGVATSSFQIEGDRKGRLDCIWDTFCSQPHTIEDGTNGDIACEQKFICAVLRCGDPFPENSDACKMPTLMKYLVLLCLY